MNLPRTLAATATLALITGGCAFAQSSSDPNGAQVDTTFVQKAAEANTREIREANLELGSGDARARTFARTMIRDHTKAENQLAAIARQLGDREQLRAGAGAAVPPGRLDGRAYLRHEIPVHQQAIALYQEESAHGRDDTLRRYAAQTLPVLQHHLTMAESFTGK